jgi:regulator of replication initiation timing
MEKHHQLKTDIVQLTEEWETLTLEAERINGELAEAEEK